MHTETTKTTSTYKKVLTDHTEEMHAQVTIASQQLSSDY